MARSALVRVPAGDDIGDAGGAAIFEGSVSRAVVPWGIELPEVDHSRLDCLRRSLSSRGFSEETVDTAFKKWEQSTSNSYDKLWQAWTAFARVYGSGPLNPSEPILSAYMTHLANDKKQAEATISKVKTVIQSHWSFSQGVGVTDALSKAAGKMNKPKGAKYNEIWDLSYVFELIAKPPSPTAPKDRLEELVVLFKAYTGWRAADLACVTRRSAIRFDSVGVHLRFFDSKMTKGRWSAWTFIPRLPVEWQAICLCQRLQQFLDMSTDWPIATMEVIDSHQNKVQESPLFVSARLDRASSLHQPWKHTTINIKAGDLFLKQVTYQGDDSLHACGFGAHSFRHAHPSALLAMGVSADKAAAHQQTSAGSLTGTYNLPVR